MYTAKIIPFDGDDSPVTQKQFTSLSEAKKFALKTTGETWATVRVWQGRPTNNHHDAVLETSHACGKNDLTEKGDYKGTF